MVKIWNIQFQRVLITSFFYLLIYSNVLGQEIPTEMKLTEQELRDRIETIADDLDADLDYSELIENLRYYLEHPLNLNFATYDELSKLVFLNEIQIYNILAYRETYGNFATIYELQGVEGMDEKTIKNIQPFITITAVKPKLDMSPRLLFKRGRHVVLGRYQKILQEKQGYAPISDETWINKPNSHYLGSPDKVLLRYGFNAMNKVRFGFTAEKDAGEPFFTSGINDSIKTLAGEKLKSGFDFLSFHAGMYDVGHLKALSIGDYQLRFGQGLTMWSGLAFGKSTEASDVKKFAQGVSPYTSADENRFFRGVATTLQFHRFDVSLFYSKNKIDATIESAESLSQEELFITTLQSSGLHRTPSEINKKDAVGFTVYGGNLAYRQKRFSIGFTGYYTKPDKPLSLSGSLYNKYYFDGTKNVNTGIDYSYLIGNFSLFGEMSRSMNGGLAQLHGISAALHPRLFLSVLYRNFAKDYQNFFNNPFSESSSTNEEGIYAGLRLSMAPRWSLSAYMDHFTYHWLRYYVDKPSWGSDYLLQVDHSLNREVNMYFRIRQKITPHNLSGAETFSAPVVFNNKVSYRYFIEYEISPTVVMKDRVEYVSYLEGNNYRGNGYLIYHDINWKLMKEKLTFSFRYALFDTDTYDERIYAYESDMLYAFSVPAYYYKGSKAYLLARYNWGNRIRLWARISNIWLTDRTTFGSGPEMIDSNQKTEIKFQVMYKI